MRVVSVAAGLLSGFVVFGQSAPAPAKALTPPANTQVLTVPALRDHGTLDLRWFAFSAPPQFRRLEWCNYLWTAKKEVKVTERAVMTAKWENAVPSSRGPEVAEFVNGILEEIPTELKSMMNSRYDDEVEISRVGGDFRIDGRIVDIDGDTMIVDVKLTDTVTHEVQIASHTNLIGKRKSMESLLHKFLKKWSGRLEGNITEDYETAPVVIE